MDPSAVGALIAGIDGRTLRRYLAAIDYLDGHWAADLLRLRIPPQLPATAMSGPRDPRVRRISAIRFVGYFGGGRGRISMRMLRSCAIAALLVCSATVAAAQPGAATLVTPSGDVVG